ncbi:MAG: Kef family K(+) transporter [Legionellales bacterium]|nr:Kef family K(+) transporter [Legionellales bacterium]
MPPHALPLITTLAAAFGLALLFGFIAARLKIPTLVGYLLAGIVLGPFTPGFVANTSIAHELSEIGVMLLMFGVGLHFSLSDLLTVRKIAVPGALIQIIVATLLGVAVALPWGFGLGGALIFGLALSVASTVVLLRALESQGLLESINGRIAVGWLVIEDLVMVLVLVLLPPLAKLLGGASPHFQSSDSLWLILGVTLLKIALFITLMLVLGRRFFPKLLWWVASSGSRELFTLSVIAAAISIAYLASILFGVSFALGAFFAGMMMRGSDLSHRAAEESLPFRDAFAVLFFVAVGMLFDPKILILEPFHVLAVVGIIIIGKSLAAAMLVLFFRYPLNTALTVSVSLAQIGEFSFILAGLGVALGLLPVNGQNLILAGALISIAVNPFIFAAVNPFLNWLRKHSALARKFERAADPLTELPMTTAPKFLSEQIVLVGYGDRVGSRIAQAFIQEDIPYVVVDQNRELVEELRNQDIAVVSGDAAEPSVLIQAHIARAKLMVIALPNTLHVQRMIEIARMLNPKIEIVVRTHFEEEAERLEKQARVKAFLGEKELAHSMSHYALTYWKTEH